MRAMFMLGAAFLAICLVGLERFVPGAGLRLAWAPISLLALLVFGDEYAIEKLTAQVQASRSGVLVDGRPAFDWKALREVTYEPAAENVDLRAGSGLVRFYGAQRRPLLAVTVRDRVEAQALLQAVGADVTDRNTFSAPTLTPSARKFVWLPGALLSMPSLVPNGVNYGAAVTSLLTVLFVIAAWFLRRRRRIRIGSAILVTRPFSTDRVALDEIEHVLPLPDNGLRLVRGGLPNVDVPIGPARVLEGDRLVALRDLVMARIEQARTRAKERGDTSMLAARLAQGTRSAETWNSELRRLRQADPTYRSSALREDDLWSVIEDPSAPEDARAAAALLVGGDAEKRARIRVVADELESPRLRIAFERVISDDDVDPLDDVVAQLANRVDQTTS